MADDADAARKERMADYRVGGRHLVHLGPDVLSRDAMQKERALTPLGEESAQRESFASSAPSQKSPRSSLTSTPRALVKRVSKRLQRMGSRASSLLEVGKQEQDFFDLDDSYLDSRKMDHRTVIRGHYPRREKWYAALDPDGPRRQGWDGLMLALVVYVLFVTPYELAFVAHVKKTSALYICNTIVDVCFWCDVLFQFNTGYYHADQGRWITDRKGIASRYLKLWFWLDMASLLPFGLMVQREDVSILRLIRLIRLIKLLRVAKAPRLLANIQVIATMSYKQKCVWKYLLVLCSMLHLMACAIRMAHDFQRGTKTHYETNSYLRWRVLESRRSSFRGNGALYVDSLDWAVSVMLGNSAYRTTAEGIISILGNLFGVMFVAFLFGDLTNILCNLDPAANEFKQTVDNLNRFAYEQQFPKEVRSALHEYLQQSEGLFRSKFHHSLLNQLSPNLQELIAHFQLGHRVVRAPFVTYARQCTLGLVVGRRLVIRPPRGHQHTYLDDETIDEDEPDDDELYSRAFAKKGRREAVIVRIHPDMQYDVRYLDDATMEERVTHDRISVKDESQRIQKAVSRMEYVTKLLVTQVAKALEMHLFMGGDFVIRKDITLNRAMYIVDSGKVMLLGSDVLKPWGMSFSPEGECFGDRSIAMIVAGHAPRPSWYNARATQISRLLVLEAAQLVEIITAPGFEQFHKFIHRFGVWASFKVAFARAMREGGIARIADEWLAREEAAAAASEEEVPLSNRLDALESKLDALLARTSSG